MLYYKVPVVNGVTDCSAGSILLCAYPQGGYMVCKFESVANVGTNWVEITEDEFEANRPDFPDNIPYPPIPISEGGTGADLSAVPNHAIIRKAGDGSAKMHYVPTANGAFYATGENTGAKFGTLPIAQGGTGSASDLTNAPNNALIIKLNNGSYNQLYFKASGNGAVYATEANGAIKFGTLPITQGGTGATDEAGARAKLGVYSTAEVQNLVNNGKTKVVKLWQNASSIMTSMEGDQYIDLGEGATFDAYDCLVVLCWFSTGFGHIASSPLIFGSLGGHVDFPKGYCGYHASRWFRRDGGNNGRYMYVGHGFKDNVQDNNYCIPQSVYGIKW